jgi:spore coat protein CotF
MQDDIQVDMQYTVNQNGKVYAYKIDDTMIKKMIKAYHLQSGNRIDIDSVDNITITDIV